MKLFAWSYFTIKWKSDIGYFSHCLKVKYFLITHSSSWFVFFW